MLFDSIKLLIVAITAITYVITICDCHDHHKHHEDEQPLKKMQEAGILPDVIDKLPTSLLSVKFGNKKVELGNVLTPTEVKDQPTVEWEAEKDTFYTLSMVDPDAPSRKEPKFREVNHWLVTNIPGSKLAEGEEIAAFMSSGPPKDTDKHRYIFLLFKQPKKLEFDHPKTGPFSRQHRLNFNIKKFAEKHSLGNPIAGNFYLAEWDSYVEERNKKITS